MKSFYFWITIFIFTTSTCYTSRFDPILKEVIKMQDFEYDAMEEFKQRHNNFNGSIETLIGIKNIKERFENNLNAIQNIFDLINQVQKNVITGSYFFKGTPSQ